MLFQRKPATLPAETAALSGRSDPIATAETHFVYDRPLKATPPEGFETALFGLGCFWGAERKFWETRGVWMTAAGYAGGRTPNPTYREVCSGKTGHAEVVEVVYDPKTVDFDTLLKVFWESHDPTQGMRQGNDVGTQYRSTIYTTTDAQTAAAEASLRRYADALKDAGRPAAITTEIRADQPFYYAEPEHQQYLAKNPHGYCGLGGTGVSCPAGPVSA